MSTAAKITLIATAALLIGWGFVVQTESQAGTLLRLEAGRVSRALRGTSLLLDPPSPGKTEIGTRVRTSGSLTTSGLPLPGETVVLTFVSPESVSSQKTVVTDNLGRFFYDYVPSSVGHWSVRAHYDGNTSHSSASAGPQDFAVTARDTFLTANLSAVSIVTGTSLSVKGALRSQNYLEPPTGILGQQTISLLLYDPSGTLVDSMNVPTTGTGWYVFPDIPLTSSGKWSLRIRFEGDANLNPSETELLTVRARPSAGYAIIAAGKVPTGAGLDSHNKTTDRAYQKFKGRGFTDDDIFYFRYGSHPNADEEATQEGIRQAIVTWASDKMNSSNGPLYILFVNHGNSEKFYVDPSAPEFEDRIIDPVELDAWISQLEDSLVGEAAEEEIVLVYGACYSGSFIPLLSHEGKRRIIITSADPDEQSFKGPMEGDGIRDGEFFVTQLLAALGKGLNLKRGFEVATAATEAYTGNLSGNGGIGAIPYADDAAQHPLLDDNGDGAGSNNALSKYPGNDGAVSAKIILGYEYTTAEPLHFTAVSPTRHLAPDDPDPVLEAEVSDSLTEVEVWVAIKPPGFDLGKPLSDRSEQREIVVPRLTFDSQPAADAFMWSNFNRDGFSGFNAPGRYEIFYFAKDVETDTMSILKSSFVYRSLDGSDEPPAAFGLLRPEVGSLENTVLFLDWEDSADPEGQRVSYTVEISTGSTFIEPEYVIEGIDGSGMMIDETVGLSDLTVYYWRVIAIDPSGNRTLSSQTGSFGTNDTNSWGNYNVLTAIVRNYNDPSTWPPDSSIEIQPYVGKIYSHYYSAMVPLGPYSVDSEAPQFSHKHDDVEVIEESPTTVLQLPEPNSGAVSGTVKNSATLSPVRGATVCLEVISGIYTGNQFIACSGDDGGFQVTDLHGAVDYRITVEKNFYTSSQDTFSLAAGENRDLGALPIGFADADSDGLPDSFEQMIVEANSEDEIDDIWDVLGTDDFDEDGRTNGEECLASSDPTSADSFLKITDICEQPNGDAAISWACEPGVYYEVYYTDDLTAWLKADGPISSSGTGSTSWTDDGSATGCPPAEATERCYRVHVY